jgi:sugar phosphate permease
MPKIVNRNNLASKPSYMNNNQGHQHKPGRVFHGWIIVVVLFLAEFSVSGMTGSTFALFFQPMEASLGWSMTMLTAAMTARGLAATFTAPIIGFFLDRYGAKWLMVFGTMSIGGAFLLLSRVTHLWQLWLLFAIAGIAGMTESGLLPTPVVVSKWFIRRRGRAMAIATSGQLMGPAVMAPIIGLMITVLEWRTTLAILGITILVLNIPAVFFFMKRLPEDIGTSPDGDTSFLIPTQMGVADTPDEPVWTLKEALRTRSFWLLVVALNFILFATTSISVHQVPFFIQNGMSIQGASYLMGASLFCGVMSRFLWSLLLDKIPVRTGLAIMAVFRASGTIGLVVIPYPYNIPPFLLLWGLLGGAFGLLQPIAFANYYGRTFQGSIQGTLRPFLNVSLFTGPLSMAILFEATGSYFSSFGLAAGLALLSSVLFLGAGPPKHH